MQTKELEKELITLRDYYKLMAKTTQKEDCRWNHLLSHLVEGQINDSLFNVIKNSTGLHETEVGDLFLSSFDGLGEMKLSKNRPPYYATKSYYDPKTWEVYFIECADILDRIVNEKEWPLRGVQSPATAYIGVAALLLLGIYIWFFIL